MGVKARLKNGDLLLEGELNERLPAVTNGIVAHYPFDGTDKQYIPNRIRYIRDWSNGSTSNTINHWVEIKAIDHDGANVAFGKSGTSSFGTWNALLTNDITTTDPYWGIGAGLGWVLVDLEDLHELSRIQVWHYWGNGRSYYDTKTEVSEDGKNWFCIFDSSIEGIYKETSVGKIHELNNLGATILPSSNANTTLTYGGIRVAEATTNLWNGGLSVYNNYGMPSSLVVLTETFMGQPIYRLGMTVTNGANLNHFRTALSSHGVHGGSLSWVQDTEYVSSIYWRPVNKPDTVFGGTASNTGGWTAGPTEYLEDNWRRFYRHRTGVGVATKSDVVHHSFYCPSLELNETIYIDFSCPQTERGRLFPTPFTSSSRARGALTLPPSLIDLNEGSVALWFKPSKGFFTYGSWNRVIGHSTVTNRNEIQIKRNGTGRNLVMSISNNAGSPSGGWSECASVNVEEDKWHHIVMRWSSSRDKISLSVNGVVKEKSGNTNLPTVKGELAVGYHPSSSDRLSNAAFKDLSIYSRYIEDSEVSKLYGSSLSPSVSGGLSTPRLVETPVGIPKDVIHIPLSLNGRNELRLIEPMSESNTVYEDGALWIGTTTTNLIPRDKQSDANGWVLEKHIDTGKTKVNLLGERVKVWAVADEGYIYLDNPLTLGTNYTSSIYVMPTMDYTFRMRLGSGTTADNVSVFAPANVWTRLINTRPINNGRTLIGYRNIDGADNPPDGFEVAYTMAQVEIGSFPTPYTPSTRGPSMLNYTGTDLTLNNWQEFSYVVTAKYSPLGTWKISGPWSNWYFGVNPTNSNLTFSRMDGTQQSISGIVPGGVPYDEWVTIGVTVKNNVSIDIYYNGERIGGRGAGFGFTSSSSNFYLNGLNSVGSSNPMNAWVKDMIFAPRVLTAKEMKEIATTQMSATKDGLQIQGQLHEGQTLT